MSRCRKSCATSPAKVKRHLNFVPITVINGQIYEGFDPATFEQVLAD